MIFIVWYRELKDILITWVQVVCKMLWMRQKNLDENRAQVNTIENRLTNLIDTIKSSTTSNAKKKLKTKNMLEIVNLLFTLINKIKQDKD